MSKRAAPDSSSSLAPAKRARSSTDRLSLLSDELLLRIFANLSIYDLNVCQRVSHLFHDIAGDSQLWKAAYYDRFVRPRVLRLPGRKRQTQDPSTYLHSAKLSRWLDEGHLVKRGKATNWKRQYKIRHNWCKGNCDVNEISVTTHPPTPPLLARLHDGIVYTVDSTAGLRAWSYKDEQKLLASKTLETQQGARRVSLPMSFAVDTEVTVANQQRLVIGFDDGAFSVYTYRKLESSFLHSYTHPSSSNGLLTAIAFTSPYILSMSEAQTLSLYKFDNALSRPHSKDVLDPPRLLTSLTSHTVWPPLSLSLRTARVHIIASIAYSIPTQRSGWSTGVQEVHLTLDGEIVKSRLASAVAQGFVPLSSGLPSNSSPSSSQNQTNVASLGQPYSKPTSLSYSHPYLLVSHSDNTLTLYLVTSSASDLSISAGRRLWGHTSSVFGAHVGGRGKAVSVSTRGNEVRIWELEGATIATADRSRSVAEEISVQVMPEKRPSTPARLAALSEALAQRGTGLGLVSDGNTNEWAVTRGWVGFDEENLVILREQEHGGQALAVYDFS